MNPVTQSLLAQLDNPALARFVTRWDALEALAIRAYRAGEATQADQAEHARLRRWLRRRYEKWQAALEPFWRQTQIEGKSLTEDPFATLLAVARPADFADNWPAMQTLPAAREALNEWLATMLIDSRGYR